MLKLPRVAKVAMVSLVAVLALAGCSNSAAEDPANKIADKGDNVTIEQIPSDEVDEMVLAGNYVTEEFTPELDGDVVTFFTSGSSSCKQEPIGAKVTPDGTKIAFKVYAKDASCTEDFGIYGWRLTFNDAPPAIGTPFFKCEGAECYAPDGTPATW